MIDIRSAGRRGLSILASLGLLLAGTSVLAGPAGQAESRTWTLRIAAERAEVRSAPDAASPILTYLNRGQDIASYEKMDGWFRVVVKTTATRAVVIGYVAEGEVEVLQVKVNERPQFWGRAAFFRGMGLSVKVYGGPSWFGSGDIGRGIRGEFAWREERLTAGGFAATSRSVEDFGPAAEISAEVIYNLSRHVAVAAGGGMARTASSSAVSFQREKSLYDVTARPTFDVASWRGGVYGFLPAGRFTAYVHGGAGWCRASITSGWSESGHGGTEAILRTSHANGLEWHGGAGVEFALNARTTLFMEGFGRVARLGRFEGLESYQRWEQGTSAIETKIEGRLWLVEDGGGTRLSILSGSPPDAAGARPASLDFRSLSLSLGLRMRF